MKIATFTVNCRNSRLPVLPSRLRLISAGVKKDVIHAQPLWGRAADRNWACVRKGRRLPALLLGALTSVAEAFLFDFGRTVRIQGVVEARPAALGIGRTPLLGINPVRLAKDRFGFGLEAFIDLRGHQRAATANAFGVDMRVFFGHAGFDRPADNEQLPYQLIHGGGGDEQTRFICGYLGCDSRPFNPLISALPPIFAVRKPPDQESWIVDLFGHALAQGGNKRAGNQTILAKLSELMFVEAIRCYIESLPAHSLGWLSGLRDRHVGKALQLIHGRPSENWTIDLLAREAGLSRTAFSERFVHFVEVPPMHYLVQWRMQVASRLLEERGMSIAQVGSAVGYESEAAFSRSFKRLLGVSPGTWRKWNRAQ